VSCRLWTTIVDSATSRHGIQSSARSVDARTVHAGMGEGGRDPDMPYIPDCIESTTRQRQRRSSTSTGHHPGRPERQRPRRVHAGRQTRESKERHTREREERRSRRAAARASSTIPSGDDDLRLPAQARQVSSTVHPQCKVARIAPFIMATRQPLDRTAGRCAIIQNLLQQPLRPPPHFRNHGDGRPTGDLGPRDFPQNPNQILAEARATP